MTNQPRDSNGQFISTEKVESEDKITFYISEFEARVIANRLERLAQRYKNMFKDFNTTVSIDQDCSYWASEFYNACATRQKYDDDFYKNGKKRHIEALYPVKVELSAYECWSIGNRLFEIGDYYEKKKNEDRIAKETKWLARRFHAEKKEQE